MKRFTIILLLFVAAGVFAQQAVIREITGTVEVKQKGSAAWETAARGQSVEMDTTISTGFKSYALIRIGNSVLNVRPLTRLTITEISTRAETETIRINLNAGKMQAEVRAPTGGKPEFWLQTPPATASVRGTVFEMGIFELWVIEGSVEYRGSSGAGVVVDAGGYSYVNPKTGRAAFPRDALLAGLDPELPIGFDNFYSFDGAVANKNNAGFDGEFDFGN